MDTRDLSSYYSGYDQYCEDLERASRVPYSDYEILEDKIEKYENVVDEIESALEEDASSLQKIKLIKSIIEDFEGEILC